MLAGRASSARASRLRCPVMSSGESRGGDDAVGGLDADALWATLSDEDKTAVLRGFVFYAEGRWRADRIGTDALSALMTVRSDWDGYAAFMRALDPGGS